jgi:hypothetical protein
MICEKPLAMFYLSLAPPELPKASASKFPGTAVVCCQSDIRVTLLPLA